MQSLILTRQQVRDVDRRAVEEYGMSWLVLMENAGRGCCDVLGELGATGPVVVCCGKGNNAGDGFVIARHLDIRRCTVRVLLWSAPEELTGDAAANFRILAKSDVPVDVFTNWDNTESQRLDNLLDGAQWIVDALLGTGAKGAPRPPLDDVIRRLNDHPAQKLAIDVPSGLDCDTGEAAEPTFRADHTCTFVAAKPGLIADAAKPLVGRIHVVDIGVPRKLIEETAAES